MNNVLAIVLTYNKKDLLKENIKCLLDQEYSDLKILVVDNKSTDGTRELIEELSDDERLNYVNTGDNLGGAGGFSYGIEYAIQNFQCDYLWIMDDDTMPLKSSLSELMVASDKLHGEFGYLSSQVVYTDGSLCNMNKQIVDKSWFESSKLLESGLLQIKKASFVSMLVKRQVVLEVGLPISDFFIWYDDTEYTARIAEKFPSFLVSKSKVLHKMKTNISLDITTDTADRLDRYRLAYRNYYYIARREGFKAKIRFYVYILKTIKRIIASDDKQKFRKIKIVLGSVIKGWSFHPKIKFIEIKR
ncbi:glycosyltransferase family 2 protein [Pediococcus pentosaceus]|uniref:glycosyltransferase family 2 protein n=1 Tax=Pediococcus pentosaceus TaxID=1255 RepID=UPI000DFC0EA9|nr:glycosyltransferase family 2 protein [Pediococcus pentosaceus]KAF0519021.1 glycosyltransferase [Pediococcus pentosaceus]MBF7111822.1 glycosyltransferase family 2 protein [Pediococcus pentosaceus]MBF7116732.1 glycosyltransferase family 2 protein [Pediococcus pentosaceus]MBF7118472.1 glycosyltransferase family 2 protein [Pediococcus pentosaceus]MCS8577510.1 glycosyltransferase [Pediococcus pentosaceus]